MLRNYVAYFDSGYIVKGLALVRSILAHDTECSVYVVCMDDACLDILDHFAMPGLHTLPLKAIEEWDQALPEAREGRSDGEYYATARPSIMLYVLNQLQPDEMLMYIDADCFFFSSGKPIFDELGENSILIHDHHNDFFHKNDSEKFGKYNSGMVCVRNDAEGNKVIRWWRDRCIEWCYFRFEKTRWIDQKYLDYFPDLTDRLILSGNIGVGVARWNAAQYTITLQETESKKKCHASMAY